MYRSLSGFKAQYHYLTLLVISDFNEWKVLGYAPGLTIHGTRQFTESKAKEHALAVAQTYIHEEKREDLPLLPAIDWIPASHDDWLVWRT